MSEENKPDVPLVVNPVNPVIVTDEPEEIVDDTPEIDVPPVTQITSLDGFGKWLYNVVNGAKPFIESVVIGCLIEAIITIQQTILSGHEFTLATIWVAVFGAVCNYLTSALRNAKVKVNGQTARAAVKYIKDSARVKNKLSRALGKPEASNNAINSLANRLDLTIEKVNPDFFNENPDLRGKPNG